MKILRTAFLFLAAYSATGTAMVVTSRMKPAARPMHPALPPYPTASHLRRPVRSRA